MPTSPSQANRPSLLQSVADWWRYLTRPASADFVPPASKTEHPDHPSETGPRQQDRRDHEIEFYHWARW